MAMNSEHTRKCWIIPLLGCLPKIISFACSLKDEPIEFIEGNAIMKPVYTRLTTGLKWVAGKMLTLLFDFVIRIFRFARFDAIRFYVRRALWSARFGHMGEGVYIYPYVIVHNPKQVCIGHRVAIAEFVHIWGRGGVVIGSDSMIASHCVITSQTHSINGDLYKHTLECKPVVIGENVWVGAGSVILPRVTIGNNSVIGVLVVL